MLAAAPLAADEQRAFDPAQMIHLLAQTSRRATVAEKMQRLPPAIQPEQPRAGLRLLQGFQQACHVHR